MASHHTPNYSLSQWEAADPVQRTDFNTDNAKLDAALAAKADTSALDLLATKAEVSAVQREIPKIAAGTYVGNGEASMLVSLGFTPKLVFVCSPAGETINVSTGYCYGGLAVTGRPAVCVGRTTVSIQNGGFRVYMAAQASPFVYTNAPNTTFHYFAIG